MPFLTPSEINTHLYGEIQNEISRNDVTLMESAIKAAIEEVGGYLSNYDRTAIFNAIGDSRNPIILLYSKDVAVWHFIQLGNPNVEIALRERRYELAITRLLEIQKGVNVPNLPLPTVPDLPEQSGQVRYGNARARLNGNL